MGGLFEDEDLDDEWDDEIEREQRNILAERWRDAARSTWEKRAVVDRYANAANGLHAHAELLGDDAVLMPEWITPPFRTLLNAVRSCDDAMVRAAADDVVRAGVVKEVGPEPDGDDDDDAAASGDASAFTTSVIRPHIPISFTISPDAFIVFGRRFGSPETSYASTSSVSIAQKRSSKRSNA